MALGTTRTIRQGPGWLLWLPLLGPFSGLWLATMDHSLLGPLSASGLRPSQPPWGVRPQGTTSYPAYFFPGKNIHLLSVNRDWIINFDGFHHGKMILWIHRDFSGIFMCTCMFVTLCNKILLWKGFLLNLYPKAQQPMGNPTLKLQGFNQVLKDAIYNIRKFKFPWTIQLWPWLDIISEKLLQ